MAKTTFSSLKLKMNDEVKTITINEKEVEVKQYLPFAEKYQLVLNVLELSEESGKFYNAVKKDMFLDLQLLAFYSNLSFTQGQQEDVSKIYDILTSSGVMERILSQIPGEERSTVENYIDELAYEIVQSKENPILAIKEAWAGSQDLRSKVIEFIQSKPAMEAMKKIVDLEEVKRQMTEGQE